MFTYVVDGKILNMLKTKHFQSAILFALCHVLLLSSCSDKVNFSTADIKKHDRFAPFIGNHEIINGYHDIDRGIIEFDVIDIDSHDAFIAKLVSAAIAEEWNINYRTQDTLMLNKNINVYGDTYENEMISIFHNRESGFLHYKID